MQPAWPLMACNQSIAIQHLRLICSLAWCMQEDNSDSRALQPKHPRTLVGVSDVVVADVLRQAGDGRVAMRPAPRTSALWPPLLAAPKARNERSTTRLCTMLTLRQSALCSGGGGHFFGLARRGTC